MRPELPFLGAGAVAIVGGTIREGHFPSKGGQAVLGTLVLTVVASATTDSRIAPLVHAIGLLLLLAAVMAATTAATGKAPVKHISVPVGKTPKKG
jgi:hypothetical protein